MAESVRDIPEEIVEKAAAAYAESWGHDYSRMAAEIKGDWRRLPTAILAAALEGCAVVQLPESDRRENECDVDSGYWDLKRATGFRGDWVQSYAIDGVPVVYDGPGPEGMYSVEEMRERCFAALAACDDAERLASGSGVGEHHGGATPEEQAVRDRRPGMWFPARYPGTCTRCGGGFSDNDDIRADGTGGWECCDE